MVGPDPDVTSKYSNDRYARVMASQGPGLHITVDAVRTLRFENVLVPEHPLKLYPTERSVRTSAVDTTNAIVAPCAVVPIQRPTLRDVVADYGVADGDVAPPLQPTEMLPTTKSASAHPAHRSTVCGSIALRFGMVEFSPVMLSA